MKVSSSSSRRGFTFLEIMLVVMIIGLLAAVIGPRLVGQGERARVQTTKQSIAGLTSALKMYEMDLGTFPSTQEGLGALMKAPSSAPEGQWDGPYLDKESFKDGWQRDLKYKFPPEKGQYFDLYSVGRDGVEGNADDVNNWAAAATTP